MASSRLSISLVVETTAARTNQTSATPMARSSHSDTAGTPFPPDGAAAGGRRSPSGQHALHHHHVEPTPELAAHLPLGAHLLEAAGAVQGDGGGVPAHDPGD